MKINIKGDLDVGEHPSGKHFCVSEKGSTFLSFTLMWSSSKLSESPPLLSWSNIFGRDSQFDLIFINNVWGDSNQWGNRFGVRCNLVCLHYHCVKGRPAVAFSFQDVVIWVARESVRWHMSHVQQKAFGFPKATFGVHLTMFEFALLTSFKVWLKSSE